MAKPPGANGPTEFEHLGRPDLLPVDGALAAEVAGHSWYHTIDLGGGVVTSGLFDHRPVVDRYLLPADLTEQRCLDVGTFDGFWAFEMERRGATEVVAIDLDDPNELDWPASQRAHLDGTGSPQGQRFWLAQQALGSAVRRVGRSVYDLDDDLGEFDLVFCGDLLVHLKDPVTAVERMRRVCRGTTIVCNPVVRFRFARRRPLAQLDGIDHFQWWALSEAALERLLLAAGYPTVTLGRSFELPCVGDKRWKGLRGIVRGQVG